MGRVNGSTAKPTTSTTFPRWRHAQRTLNNIKLTLLSGFITILVLRGTIGIGNLSSTSSQAESQALIEDTNRVLAELFSDPDQDSDGKSHFDPNKVFKLGPKIENWDTQRQEWLKQNPDFASTVNGKGRVLLLSGSNPDICENPYGDHYLLKSVKNKIDYCRLHGMEIMYNMVHLDTEMSGYWAKLPLIRKMMISHPEFEWIWWLDSDAFFTDMVFEIPFERYKDHNFVIHGYDELLYKHNSWVALNTGSFLIRNTQWALDLLDAWAPMGPAGPVREKAGKLLSGALKGRPPVEADDQSALIYLMLSQKDKWMDKVYVENSYYLQGFWMGLVTKYEKLEEMYQPGFGDERWPFVTHFVGCKACTKFSGSYSAEKCLKSMEKAYNFADNQVLKLYGYKHRGLLSPNIAMFRNESTYTLKFVDDNDIRKKIVSKHQ